MTPARWSSTTAMRQGCLTSRDERMPTGCALARTREGNNRQRLSIGWKHQRDQSTRKMINWKPTLFVAWALAAGESS
jgi:hypothetical protein